MALTRDGQSETVIQRARDVIEARDAWSSAERADHLAVLWFVAEAEDVPAKVIQCYPSEGRLMESELYKSIFGKGEAKGEMKGEARGKAEAYADVLIQLLIHRTGSIDFPLRERIRTASDVDTLKAWHSEVLFAGDADALRRVADKIRNAPRG